MQTEPPDSIFARLGEVPPAGGRQARSLATNPALADLASSLLRTDGALAELLEEEAACVVGYMGLVAFSTGARIFHEGDSTNSSYMLLILSGEVTVETADHAGGGQVEISVLGPGNVIGEMSLLDGSPRSATCTSATVVEAGGLTRKSLQRLLEDNPRVGAKLLVGLCRRLCDRLRGMSDQLQIYARLNSVLQQQLERTRLRP